jgi:hypothetical protein
MSTRRIGSVVPKIIGDLSFRQYTAFRIIARTALQGVHPDLVFGLKIHCRQDESEDLWLDGRIHAGEICEHLSGPLKTTALCKKECRVEDEGSSPIPLIEKLDCQKPEDESACLMSELAIRHMARRGKVEIVMFSETEIELCLIYGRHTLTSKFPESKFCLFLS